jgi:DNA-binding beta-propeller fold protein YncE
MTPERFACFKFREKTLRPLIALLLLAIPATAADKLVTFATGLHDPFGMDFLDGRVVLAEAGANRIVRLDETGKAAILAGSGQKGFRDGVGETAEFSQPHNLAVAPDGNIYVADTMNHRVRKLDSKTRAVTTIAGGEKGFAGDGGPAKDARFDQAYHVALDAGAKNLYVCDLGNRRIRKIDLATGTIATVAGNGNRGVPEDGAVATHAPFVDPRAVAVDKAGRLWILERSGNALRVVENGKVRTVAGSGEKGYGGDGGPALQAKMDGPKFLWIDPVGDVLIADTENHCVRKYSVQAGTINRVAGTAKKGKDGVGGPATDVSLSRPHGVGIGPGGAMYISDSDNGRVLKTAK